MQSLLISVAVQAAVVAQMPCAPTDTLGMFPLPPLWLHSIAKSGTVQVAGLLIRLNNLSKLLYTSPPPTHCHWLLHSLGPSLKGRYGEERHHCRQDIVKMEFIMVPYPLTKNNLGWIIINIIDEVSPGRRETRREVFWIDVRLMSLALTQLLLALKML